MNLQDKYKCPRPGCNEQAISDDFISEVGLIEAGTALTRKPLAVRRCIAATCLVHGPVTINDLGGHHLSKHYPEGGLPRAAVVIEMEADWQAAAFAVVKDDDGRGG